MRGLTLLLLLAVTLAAGCGQRGPLVPPDEAFHAGSPAGGRG